MILPLQTFATLLENMSAGLQGGAAQIVDLSVGSVTRALLESCASIALWMQWLILQVLSMTRAATSSGSDLDSWMGDFSFVRLPGSPSSGVVTFARYTLGLSSTISVGSIVKTNDGSLSFVVVQDSNNSAWNGNGGYLLPSTLTSVDLPVQAALQGSAGNILGGAIGLLASAIVGVDRVTNANTFSGGLDAESDNDFRARFQVYINSRSLATRGAIETALRNLQQGLRYTVLENVNLLGQAAAGNFCVIVDDGSGSATDTLISEVSAAIDVVRPLGATFSVTRPVQLDVSVEVGLMTFPGMATGTLGAQVAQAATVWIDALPMGGILAISKLEAIAHATSDAVESVTFVLVNGAGSDVRAPPGAVIQLAGVNVVVS